MTLTTRDDAAGGCDGVTNGKWGFHTGQDVNPWWQVDLGQVQPLSQVRVWNRADSEDIAARAANFMGCCRTTARTGVKFIGTTAKSSMAIECRQE